MGGGLISKQLQNRPRRYSIVLRLLFDEMAKHASLHVEGWWLGFAPLIKDFNGFFTNKCCNDLGQRRPVILGCADLVAHATPAHHLLYRM